MGCDCDCHEKLNKIGVLGCCFKCEAEHDPLRNALLQVCEAREIILAIHKNPQSHEAQTKAVKFLNTALCEERVDRVSYGRETCGHVLPCPMHKPFREQKTGDIHGMLADLMDTEKRKCECSCHAVNKGHSSCSACECV